ncbi:uncharacterized protein B0I36DRAFT_210377, partial [Microdochium trichocladiopsis]
LGPLTTTWEPRADCSLLIAECDSCNGAKQAQFCGQDARRTDNGDCWPPRAANAPSSSFPFNGWGFYSPGLACPTGYAPACMQTAGGTLDEGFDFQFPLAAQETAVGCCPSGYTCAYVSNGAQTCQSVASNRAVVTTGTCNLNRDNIAFSPKTIPFLATITAAQQQPVLATVTTYTLQAPLFQLVYRSSDSASFPAITPPSQQTDLLGGLPTPTTLPGGGGIQGPATSSNAGPRISLGAAVGIGIG